MSEGENKKRSPFSIYWIYAIIGIAIIGFQLFMSNAGRITLKSSDQFIELGMQGYIKDAKIVNASRVDFTIEESGKDFINKQTGQNYKSIQQHLNETNNVKKGDPIFEFKIIYCRRECV